MVMADREQAGFSAGALFVRGAAVLMIEPSYKGHWDLPGGQGDIGETPKETVTREIGEELGVKLRTGRLLVVDYLRPTAERGAIIAYVFDGGEINDDAIEVDGTEVTGWHWTKRDEMFRRTRTAPMLCRRIEHAVSALKRGITFHLEDSWSA
jgi:8-oxo-dGTP diphosphatase